MTTRRRFIGAGMAAAAAPAVLPARALGQTGLRKMTVGVGGFTFAYLPLFVAHSAGHLKEEGLDVTLVQTGSGATAMAAMLGGSFDVMGLVLSDVLTAASKGQKISVFAPLMTQYASDSIVSKAAAARVGLTADMPLVERVRRLKGLTLAVSGRGSGTDKMWRYLLKEAGLDADRDVTLTVTKLDQMYPALRARQIDGYNTTAPSNNRAVAEGLGAWVARPSQGEVPGLENFVYTVLAARAPFLADNQDVMTRFVRGLARGNALLHADPDAAARAVHATPWAQTELQLLKDTIADQRTAFAPRMALSQAAFDQNRDFMLAFGEDVRSVQYADVINSKFVDAVAP